MTEVPEHLLRRAQERRAALSGGGEGGPPPAPPGEGPGTGAAGSAVEPAGGSAVAPAATAPVEQPPKPLPPYVQAAMKRPRVPTFVVPVLAALPVWALVYAGAFTKPAQTLDPEVERGKQVFLANCSGCHGGGGEGGTGRPLAGQVLLTFPNKADHIAWVHNGSPAAGTPYGDPNRPGGQRISQTGGFGAMPAFKGTLSDADIAAVVRYEREVLGGGEPQPSTEAELNWSTTGGSPSGSGTADAQGQGGKTGGSTTSTSAGNESTSTTTKSSSSTK